MKDKKKNYPLSIVNYTLNKMPAAAKHHTLFDTKEMTPTSTSIINAVSLDTKIPTPIEHHGSAFNTRKGRYYIPFLGSCFMFVVFVNVFINCCKNYGVMSFVKKC